MKKISIITLCLLLTVESNHFIQAMREAEPTHEESSYTQAEHDQVVADHQATMAKQQAILESSKSTAAQKADAQNTMQNSKMNVMDSHAKLQENSGGLDMSSSQSQYSDVTSAKAKSMEHSATSADGNTTVTTKFDAQTGRATSTTTSIYDPKTDITTEMINGKKTSQYKTDPKTGEITTTSFDPATGKPSKVVTKDQNGNILQTGELDPQSGNLITTKFNTDGNGGKTIIEKNPKTGETTTTITKRQQSSFINEKGKWDTKTTDVVVSKKSSQSEPLIKDPAKEPATSKTEVTENVNKTDAEKKSEAQVIELQSEALNAKTPEQARTVIEKTVDAMAPVGTDPARIAEVKTEVVKESKNVDVSKPSIFKSIIESISRMFGKSAPATVAAKQVNLF